VLTSHANFVNVVAFSPDGSLAASASNDNTVKVYLVKDKFKEAKTLTHHTGLALALAFG
jgi:WD40 repeat protein